MQTPGGPFAITVNGKSGLAPEGATLLDAALDAKVVIPHDCCNGQCETCRVTVVSGSVDAAGTREGDTVLACLAKVSGPVVLAFEEVPAVAKRSGTVTVVDQVSPDIWEIVVRVGNRLPYLPGQYVKVAFAGLPERDYSPTIRLSGDADEHELVFHLRRYPDGVVSSQIGQKITAGAKATIRGPYGNAWLRRGKGPIVLVSSGTGWAPIWSIAAAARLGQPERPVTIIAGASDPANLYMRPSLQWLWARGARELFLASSAAQGQADVWRGRPTELVPQLTPEHDVYVAGHPDMVAAVKAMAQAAGATCHADPFTPATPPEPTLTERFTGLFRSRPASGKPNPASAPARKAATRV